jgi:Secretion system C-terminal sorting domain
MKKIFLYFAILFSISSYGQTDIWDSVITDGFSSPIVNGNALNYNVLGFLEFKGMLYATSGRKGNGSAVMYKTADGVNWTQVNYTSSINIKGIPSFGKMGSTYMWIGTGNGTDGTEVYRTSGGNTWTAISTPGFGNGSSAPVPTPNMLVFQGTNDSIPYLYAAGNSHGGSFESIIYRTPYNNSNPNMWNTVIDFNQDPAHHVTQVTYFYVWNNTLYFATNDNSNTPIKLYESSDGVSFTENTGFSSVISPTDALIACISEDYNGVLYAGTNNRVSGGQLYRTTNGIMWEKVTDAIQGHRGAIDNELHDIEAANGYLWLTFYTDTTLSNSGMRVFRSTTGSDINSFIQSNTDGFGNDNIDGENPAIYGFKDYVYFGGPNYSTGGVIYRTQSTLLSINDFSEKDCKIIVYPNPISKVQILNIQSDCHINNIQVSIYDITGKLLITTHSTSINIKNFQTGIYFYSINNDGRYERGKIIID